MKKQASAADPLWYKDAIIYELHVRAFADSNGDGIGDFPGLLSRLDYLQDLGITCIWLLPFFPSPLRDDGYDIANYVDVNPVYGSLDDFKAFLKAAHQRNMQVMIELVINHTSDQHPWFKAAQYALPGSAAHEMYVWSDTDQLYKDARIIFTDTEKSNWTWDETAKAYYWHRFFSHQPDLNFDNPMVIEEVVKAMRFWLDMGVDALRMDAIPYLVERDGTSCENLPETHVAIKAIRAAIDADYSNRLILAEANQWPADVRPYFGEGDECHMAFHFPLMPRIYMALRQEDRLPITDIMAQTPAIPDNCQWGLFLRNHDELTLEMVTDDERDYMYFAYSADPRMRINVGIRRRLAPLVDNNRRRIELLNSLLLSFPGTPILYYGDELGMGDNIYLGDRNGVRTPMQWNSDRNAGFSKCDPARLYFPVVMDPIYGYQVVNVEAQLSDQSSLLHWTRNMIALRKLFQVFGRGTLRFLNPANRKVLAYLRDLDRGDGTHETVLCVANLSRFAQPVSLDLPEHIGFEPVEMLGYVPFPRITNAPYPITLAPYSFLWLELQVPSAGADPQPTPLVVTAAGTIDNEVAPLTLLSQSWREFLVENRGLLEASIRNWLPRQRWFGAKSRSVEFVRILNWVELLSKKYANAITPALFFVELTYADSGTDTYQIPLAISSGSEAEDVTANYSQTILANITYSNGFALLHDATAREDFRTALLGLMRSNETLILADSDNPADASAHPPATLQACGSKAFAKADLSVNSASRIGIVEQSNTSILYGNERILKLFRRLEPGENPDVEIGRFLTDVADFPHIAPFLGEISTTSADGQRTTIAMLQELVTNEGDGWHWFLSQLADFLTSISATEPPSISSAPSRPPGFLDTSEPHRELLLHAGVALQAATLLGQRTAEMHLALATPTKDLEFAAAFAAEPVTSTELAGDAHRIEIQITSTLEALRAKLSSLQELVADDAALLLSRRMILLSRAHAIATMPAAGQRIRIHGDYHLGQVLRTSSAGTDLSSTQSGDFVVLDFEGEPARSLDERRQQQSPLKDVAGMIRSFSYATYSGLDKFLADDQLDLDSASLRAWAILWQDANSAAFLRAYRDTIAIAVNPKLLPSPQQSQLLLEAYLLEKALYELQYELNNRPTWLHIPLAGILAL